MADEARVTGVVKVQDDSTGKILYSDLMDFAAVGITKWQTHKVITVVATEVTLEDAASWVTDGKFATVLFLRIKSNKNFKLNLNGDVTGISSCKEMIVKGTITEIQVTPDSAAEQVFEYLAAGV